MILATPSNPKRMKDGSFMPSITVDTDDKAVVHEIMVLLGYGTWQYKLEKVEAKITHPADDEALGLPT